MNNPELRQACASRLETALPQVKQLSAFVGFDGFVDEIIHVVDKRESAEKFTRVPTIAMLAERLARAAGHSTNVELVPALTKLGGNGPIMANALASFGMQVTYVGCLGRPEIHPVFHDFAKRATVVSIAEVARTDALEFDDGKVMFGKHSSLKDVNWENLTKHFGKERLTKSLQTCDLAGFVNWTMLPYMNEIWEGIQKETCPKIKGKRRTLFFDLADPEKRTKEDIQRALKLIVKFEKHFNVILGLNEKECHEIAEVLGLNHAGTKAEDLTRTALQIAEKVAVGTLVVHPVSYALAVSQGVASVVEGPFVKRPKITTGAGDHFNSGFCLGKLLGMDNGQAVLTGVTTSGSYVRTAKSPSVKDLIAMLRKWPKSSAE